MKRFILISVLAATFISLPASAQTNELPESVTWTRIMSTGANLPLIGAVKPLAPTQDSYWSIGCECLDREYGNFDEYKPYLHTLGIGYARIQSGWQMTEKKKGKYDFAWLDNIVDGIIDEGLKPWMTLCYGNSLYAFEAELNAKIFDDSPVMDAWLKYVRATVRRYRGKVVCWEVWNEPKDAKLYTNLFIRTADIIREEDPHTPIAGISFTGGQALSCNFLKGCMKILKEKDRFDLLDIVTYHPYFDMPEWGVTVAQNVKDIVASYSPRTLVCQGEAGCPSILEFAHALAGREWSEYSQAKWYLRRMATDFSLSMPCSLFTFVDLLYDNPTNPEKFANMQQHFGLLRCATNGKVIYKKPSFHAVGNMAAVLTKEFHAIDMPVETYGAGEMFTVGIANREGKPVGFMIWKAGRQPSDNLEMEKINLKVGGIKFSKPVYIEPLSGRIYDGASITSREGKMAGETRFREVPVWDSPIIIMEASALGIEEIVWKPVVNLLE